jgi:hypothetical protein
VIAELHAFDDDAVTNVQAGDYAFGKNDCISFAAIRFSRRALPEIA